MTKTIRREISKLQKVPHPKSRKTAKLTKSIIKEKSREKSKLTHHMKTNLLGEKFLWFQQNIDKNVSSCTPKMVLSLMERYLKRFDDEMEQIQLKHNIGKHRGRQHASREDAIRMTQERELTEFTTCGLEMPDLLNAKQFEQFKNWSGELRFLQNFKVVRYSKKMLEHKLNLNEEQASCSKVNETRQVDEESNVEKVEESSMDH